jgi:4-diphosphocytidyl-2-C-methyl-D-erythritol kinase
MRLTALAPGKVNLCLFVGAHRPDGRHEVVTLLESVSLADELTLATAESGEGDRVVCDGVDGTNIVGFALAGLRARGWNAPSVEVEITKRIPVAAGMGGGSADAAAALRLAAEVEAIGSDAVGQLAAELGADVPSQLDPGLSLGDGAGDQISALEPLAPHAVVLVPLPHQLPAGEVYAEFDRLGLARDPAELSGIRDRVSAAAAGRLPGELIVNDLEPAAMSLCPEIEGALGAVRAAGADHALVSGSGPTVFGLLWGADSADRAATASSALARRYLGASSAVPVAPGFGHPRVSAQLGE